MGAEEKLRAGMRPPEVCDALHGWKLKEVCTTGDPPHLHTYDFISPDGRQVVRVTFDEAGVIAWGEPGD